MDQALSTHPGLSPVGVPSPHAFVLPNPLSGASFLTSHRYPSTLQSSMAPTLPSDGPNASRGVQPHRVLTPANLLL